MYLGYGLCSAWTANTEDCRLSFTTRVTAKKSGEQKLFERDGFL